MDYYRHQALIGPETEQVLREVADERVRQRAKFGNPHHAYANGPHETALPYCTYGNDAMAIALQRINDENQKTGEVTFSDVLLEEVFEALASSDPGRLREELVQVAAVAVQWIEDIDRHAL